MSPIATMETVSGASAKTALAVADAMANEQT